MIPDAQGATQDAFVVNADNGCCFEVKPEVFPLKRENLDADRNGYSRVHIRSRTNAQTGVQVIILFAEIICQYVDFRRKFAKDKSVPIRNSGVIIPLKE